MGLVPGGVEFGDSAGVRLKLGSFGKGGKFGWERFLMGVSEIRFVLFLCRHFVTPNSSAAVGSTASNRSQDGIRSWWRPPKPSGEWPRIPR